MPVDVTDPRVLPFPNNIVETVVQRLSGLSGIDTVVRRPLRIEDPNASCGVYPLDWQPNELEIGDLGPTIATYQLAIQLYHKHSDGEQGRRDNSSLSKSIRGMLYRDHTLQVALAGLSETSTDGSKERLQRWGVRRQRFAANELQGQFVHFSTTEMWIETTIN